MIPSCELLIAIDRASGGRASAARPRRREPPSHISSVRSQTSNSPRSTPTPSAPNRRMLPSSDGVAPSRRASFANSQSLLNSISGSAQATAIPRKTSKGSSQSVTTTSPIWKKLGSHRLKSNNKHGISSRPYGIVANGQRSPTLRDGTVPREPDGTTKRRTRTNGVSLSPMIRNCSRGTKYTRRHPTFWSRTTRCWNTC